MVLCRALKNLGPLVGPDTMLVSTQNGVEGPEFIAAQFGEARTVAGVVGVLSYIESPGVIRKHSAGTVTVGEFYTSAEEPSARVVALVEALVAAGVDARATTTIKETMWTKLTGAPRRGLGEGGGCSTTTYAFL